MAIPTVYEVLELPGGDTPPSNARDRIRIRARLVAGERGDEVGYAEAAGRTVASVLYADLDDTGRWELQLRYNSGSDEDAITAPTGTRWEITPVYYDGASKPREGQRRYCAIDSADGAGPHLFADVEVGDENTVPPTAASVIQGQISGLESGKEDVGVAQELVDDLANGPVAEAAQNAVQALHNAELADNNANSRVSRSGDTMEGPLDLDGNRVTGLPEPAADHEPARKAETDALDAAKVAKSGLDADLPAAGNKITGLGVPTDAADAARKADVDTVQGNLDDYEASASTIASLPDADALDGTEILPADQDGTTVKVTVSQLGDGLLAVADLLTSILAVDGPGSGIDADTVDGAHLSALAQLSVSNIFTAQQRVRSGTVEARFTAEGFAAAAHQDDTQPVVIMLNLSGTGIVAFGAGGTTAPDVALTRAAAGVLTLANLASSGVAFELVEQSAPAAPSANRVRLFAQDNGSGKTQLMARFASGAAQQIAIEP